MTSVAYRCYVLFLLLLVYIHCMLSRMLPAFLVSVPTPGCGGLCATTLSAPLCHRRDVWTLPDTLGQEERRPDPAFTLCQECRARTGEFADGVEDGNWFNMQDGACIGRWQYGLLMGYGFALPFVLGSWATARLVDAVDRRLVLAAAAAAWSGAVASAAGANSFEPLLASRFLLGAAESFVVPASFSLVTDYFEERSQGSAGSVLSAGVCLGAGVASWAVPLALQVGWQAACLLVGGIGMLLATLVAGTIAEPCRECSNTGKVTTATAGNSITWLLTAAAALRLAASYTIAAYLPAYYLRAGLPGYSPSGYASSNAGLVAGSGLVSAVVGGIIADHWSARLASAPSVLAALANGCALLLYLGVLAARTFVTSMVLYGCALLLGEGWYGLLLLQVKRAVPQAVQGQTITAVLSVATLVSNAAPAAVGAMDPGDAGLGQVLAAVIALSAGLSALCFLLAAVLLERSPQQKDEGGQAHLRGPLLQVSDEARPCAALREEDGRPSLTLGSSSFLLKEVTSEVSVQLHRQVSISSPGHAEVVTSFTKI